MRLRIRTCVSWRGSKLFVLPTGHKVSQRRSSNVDTRGQLSDLWQVPLLCTTRNRRRSLLVPSTITDFAQGDSRLAYRGTIDTLHCMLGKLP